MPVKRTGNKVVPKQLEPINEDPPEDKSSGSDADIFNAASKEEFIAETPSGTTIPLWNEQEKIHYENLASKYQEDNLFKNISDLTELDRLLSAELMVFRWGNWLMRERDYDDGPINVTDLQKYINDTTKVILSTKKALGIDKATRDVSASGSLAEYIHMLQVRAREMGIHRDNQNYKAFNLWKELQSKITLSENSIATERTEFEVHPEQIIEWIRSKFYELDELDEHFRVNQKIWIRDMQ